MGLFNLFKKKDGASSPKKGFHEVQVSDIIRLTEDAVQITFSIPEALKEDFNFVPGQYINVCISLDGKEEIRSYSICSGPGEALAIGVKKVTNGLVSKWLNTQLPKGSNLLISQPMGGFTLEEGMKHVVAIAAGSGITPILSMAKSLEKTNVHMDLFYGNQSMSSTMFYDQIETLEQTTCTYFFSKEQHEKGKNGRIDKENFTALIKENLPLLKADGFFLCGPEELIRDVSEVLTFFGVGKNKIHVELFSAPVLMAPQEQTQSTYTGVSKVEVILDGETTHFDLDADGKTILEMAEKMGIDAPFSCRGGVCSTCKAKVLKGSANMTLNYSLTDKEVAEGYILTCQAHPTSDELIVSFDA